MERGACFKKAHRNEVRLEWKLIVGYTNKGLTCCYCDAVKRCLTAADAGERCKCAYRAEYIC